MTEPEQYVVIEDIMIQMTGGGPVLLAANQTQTVTLPANGSTWRLEIPQAPFHPWSTQRGVSVEGCGTNGSGNFSTGFVTQFPYADESPAFDTDCHENVASSTPTTSRDSHAAYTTAFSSGKPGDFLPHPFSEYRHGYGVQHRHTRHAFRKPRISHFARGRRQPPLYVQYPRPGRDSVFVSKHPLARQ